MPRLRKPSTDSHFLKAGLSIAWQGSSLAYFTLIFENNKRNESQLRPVPAKNDLTDKLYRPALWTHFSRNVISICKSENEWKYWKHEEPLWIAGKEVFIGSQSSLNPDEGTSSHKDFPFQNIMKGLIERKPSKTYWTKASVQKEISGIATKINILHKQGSYENIKCWKQNNTFERVKWRHRLLATEAEACCGIRYNCQ